MCFTLHSVSRLGCRQFQSTAYGRRRHNCLIRKMLFLQSILHDMPRPTLKLRRRCSLPYLAKVNIAIRQQSIKMIADTRHIRQLMQELARRVKG